jgi:nitronate monooxygenase
VTEGGGFGFLGSVREPVDLIRSEVAFLRARGIERFDVTLILAATDPSFEAQGDLHRTPRFRDVSERLIARLRAAEMTVACQVGSLAEARVVEQAGAQILIAQAIEAGGSPRSPCVGLSASTRTLAPRGHLAGKASLRTMSSPSASARGCL